MKNQFYLLFIFSLLSISAIGQNSNYSKERKWQIGIFTSTTDKVTPLAGLNIGIDYSYFGNGDKTNKSFAIGILGNYFFKLNSALRMKVGITDNHILDHAEDEVGGQEIVRDADIKQNVISISPGILWNANISKLNFYGGFEIPVLIYTKLKYSLKGIYTNINDGVIESDVYSVITSDGGFACGAGIFTGFNIQLIKRFSLGGEFSFGLLYTQVGGDNSTIQTQRIPTEHTWTEFNKQKNKTFCSPRLLGQINIFYSF
jgi:hypothetical protein